MSELNDTLDKLGQVTTELDNVTADRDHITVELNETKEQFALVCEALGMVDSRDIDEALSIIQELHKTVDFTEDSRSEYTLVLPTNLVIH